MMEFLTELLTGIGVLSFAYVVCVYLKRYERWAIARAKRPDGQRLRNRVEKIIWNELRATYPWDRKPDVARVPDHITNSDLALLRASGFSPTTIAHHVRCINRGYAPSCQCGPCWEIRKVVDFNDRDFRVIAPLKRTPPRNPASSSPPPFAVPPSRYPHWGGACACEACVIERREVTRKRIKPDDYAQECVDAADDYVAVHEWGNPGPVMILKSPDMIDGNPEPWVIERRERKQRVREETAREFETLHARVIASTQPKEPTP